MRILTVATDRTPMLQNLEETARMFGHDLTVVGLGRKWEGWRGRMAWYRDAMKDEGLRPDDVVALIDAYDVLIQNPMTDAQARHVLLEDGKYDMRVGMESGCDPANCGDLSGALGTAEGDDVPGDRRYMNAGVIFGRVDALTRALQWALDEGFTDDQVGLSRYVATHPERVAPDKDRRLVSNLLGEPLRPRLPRSVFAHVPSAPFQLHQRNAYNYNCRAVLGADRCRCAPLTDTHRLEILGWTAAVLVVIGTIIAFGVVAART